MHKNSSDPLSNVRSMGELMLEAIEEMRNPIEGFNYSSFPKLSTLTQGARPHELTILCGPTGLGKTTLCANLSADLVIAQVPHYVASVETGPHDFTRRVMSAISGKNYFLRRKYTDLEVCEFLEKHSGAFLNKSHVLSLYENRFTVESLMQEIDAVVKKFGVKYVMVDNLNFFLNPTSAQNANLEMDRVIHELVVFQKKTPVHFVLVMHPKKTDNERVESVFDIKGSSTAVQEAHNVLLFNRPHPKLVEDLQDEIDVNKFREIKFAKVRNYGGGIGKRLILQPDQMGLKYEEFNLYYFDFRTGKFKREWT